MNKYVMLAVKQLIGLMPKQLKSRLKQNTTLVEFYSHSLHRSGLFYGRPSKKKHLVMYRKYLAHQTSLLQQLYPNVVYKQSITAIVFGARNLEKTLKSLNTVPNVNCVKVIELPSRVPLMTKHSSTLFYNSLDSALGTVMKTSSLLLINGGDEVSPYIGAEIENALEQYDMAYCDTDYKDGSGKRVEPSFFPDWNPELQFSTGYVKTGVAIKNTLIDRLCSSLKRTHISTIAQLVTHMWLNKYVTTPGHISRTLLHEDLFAYFNTNRHLASIANLVSSATGAAVKVNKKRNVNEVEWPLSEEPLVSLIIPTKNAWQLVKACIDSIQQKTLYSRYEILLIDNGSDEPESLQYFESLKEQRNVRVLRYPGPFNYSAINNFGVRKAHGEIVGLVNNDIEVIEPSWLRYMVGHAVREDIGCVGAKLLYSDERVQHAGVVLGYGGGAGHAHKYFPKAHSGYLHRLAASSNYSAVTAACLLVKRSHFEAVKGLNEVDLAVAFNDVDLCLKVAALGVRNVYCAEAELFHHEPVSRGSDLTPEKAARFHKELQYLQSTWRHIIERDPCYSENLTLRRENFAIKEQSEF